MLIIQKDKNKRNLFKKVNFKFIYIKEKNIYIINYNNLNIITFIYNK